MMWTVLANSGTPMQEASLCEDHYKVTQHEYLDDAASAEDWGGQGWTQIPNETATNNDVYCVECKLEGK